MSLRLRATHHRAAAGRSSIPVYKGTYERAAPERPGGPNAERDLRIAWSRDLGRAIDYLETRADIDTHAAGVLWHERRAPTPA